MPIDVEAMGSAPTVRSRRRPPRATGSVRSPISRVLSSEADPAEEAVVRESVRLAFVAALQHLPPRQRAVLILREVLKWKANEVAELLDTTVVSVNSALQRARSTLAERNVTRATTSRRSTTTSRSCSRVTSTRSSGSTSSRSSTLLHEDATMSMPPYPLWLQGAAELAHVAARPRERVPRLAATKRSTRTARRASRSGGPTPDGGYEAWAIHVLHVSDGRIASLDFFVDKNLFPLFGLPIRIEP